MRLMSRLLPALILLVLLTSGGYVSIRLLAGQDLGIGTPLPNTRFAPGAGQVYLGVSTHGLVDGVAQWDSAAGISGHPALYGRWTKPDGPFAPILTEMAQRPGVTPIVHWNLPFTGDRVGNGSRDFDIKAQAAAVKAFRKPVFVRLDWEMNADWYPGWNPPAVSPSVFVESWRHVVGLFAGVPNVAFVWAPNVFSVHGYQTSQWYPGDSYIDWIGLDAYPQSAPEQALLHGPGAMEDTAVFAEKHSKPVMLAEWAVNTPHPDSAQPIDLVFDWAARHPVVRALVYFDFNLSTKDFRLASHPIAAAEYRARTAGKPQFLLSVPGDTGNGGPSPTGPPDTYSPSPKPTSVPPSQVPTPSATPTPTSSGNTGLGAPQHLIGIQSYTSVALHWRPVPAATQYEIYRDGTRVTETTATSYIDTGLRSGRPYTWTVAAADVRGVPGDLSLPFIITPGRWGTHPKPCTFGPAHRPCRYPSEGPPLVP
ncbi:MAG: Beta-mannanase [Actinomycetia bacterium]|nr:Beta-mannanase [Actinomycetes bacterium]